MLMDIAKQVVGQQGAGLFSAPANERRRAEAWLDSMKKRAQRTGVFSEAVKVTPAIAELLLENNPQNRNISPLLVRRLTSEMMNGRWERNGETIIIADTGELNDGQHRCSAAIESGCSFDTIAVFGVPRTTRNTLDQGIKRTVGQIVAMHGHTDGNHLAHAARILFGLLNFQTVSRNPERSPSATQVMDLLEEHPNLPDSLTIARQAHKKRYGGVGLFAGLHYYCAMRTTRKEADEFFEVFISSLGFRGKSDPAYILQKRLIEGGRLTETERAAFTIKAFIGWRSKSPMRILRLIDGEEFPLV